MEEHGTHVVTLEDRRRLSVTAVAEVAHFEDTVVALRTPLGVLVVQGQELKLKQLSPQGGQVTVEGKLSGLSYEEPRGSRGLFGRGKR